jgi:ketosteroid isomerase-like protein
MARAKAGTASLMQTPDEIEAQFYEAMQQGNLDRMMAVWADDDEAVCVHPGGARVIGAGAIRASFGAIFGKGGVAVHPQSVHRVQTLSCAVHHLVEHVALRSEGQPRLVHVHATNVYLKTEQGWRMVAHHASPGNAGDAPEGLKAEPTSTLH